MLNKTNVSKYHTFITLLLRAHFLLFPYISLIPKMNKMHYAFF